jgi:hypothetical protein
LAGKILRGFRTYLNRKYLKDVGKFFVDAERPTEYADVISLKEWDIFKAKRKTPKFQSVSDVNHQRASSPAYPYKKWRLGYARLEQKIVSIYKLQ